ncbi:hypothetical protein C8R43DRAFT_951069 [Mycena crocata]|nr:hypothetical protein C8R43DRAFT_951069 [Mycena crocata]
MGCTPEFFENPNYIDDREHDTNPRKHWYIVPGIGLFSKRCDADAQAEHEDDVDVFYVRHKAEEAWARDCRANHPECRRLLVEDNEVVPDSESEAGAEHDEPDMLSRSRLPATRATSGSPAKHAISGSPTKRAISGKPASMKPTVKKEKSVKRETPVKRETSLKHEHFSVKREELKREVSTPSPIKRLPLWADGDDDEEDELAMTQPEDYSHAARRKRSVSVPPRGGAPKRARGGHTPRSPARVAAAASRSATAAPTAALPTDISPTVSSVSSLSAASSTSTHPFLNLGDSVETVTLGPSKHNVIAVRDGQVNPIKFIPQEGEGQALPNFKAASPTTNGKMRYWPDQGAAN